MSLLTVLLNEKIDELREELKAVVREANETEKSLNREICKQVAERDRYANQAEALAEAVGYHIRSDNPAAPFPQRLDGLKEALANFREQKGEPTGENPSYGPGNPDWDRDRLDEMERA